MLGASSLRPRTRAAWFVVVAALVLSTSTAARTSRAGRGSGKPTITTTSSTTSSGTTVATTSTTVPPNLAPSGEPMPVGDLPGWQQVFADDFAVNVPLGSFPAAVSTKWWAYPDGWKDTSKNGTYMPSRVVSIANGVMNLNVHTEAGVHLVAAPVPRVPPTGTTQGQLYGRYAVRFRADPLAGYKAAWLLWPDSEVWPRDGEIDFPEGNLNGNICAFLHHQGATTGNDQEGTCTTAAFTTWHTAVIEWNPTSCVFTLDGTTIMTSTTRIPNTSMHWVLQTETALNSVPLDSTAGNVEIDWVTAYRRV